MNNINCNMPITPLSLGNSHLRLNIPIYQRLFVWGEEQINQLLKDLYESFLTNREQPYYIGIINILEKEQEQVIVWDIIDGQQRLTFLSLFGAYAISKTNNKQWNNFLFEKNSIRIHYSGRDDEENELKLIANPSPNNYQNIHNPSFVVFLKCIESFSRKIPFDSFSDYVYTNASFLVSKLPRHYNSNDLNLYFERMNSSGKQLTPIEQIKGKYFASFALLFDTCINFEKGFDDLRLKIKETRKKSKSNNDIEMRSIRSILLTNEIIPKKETAYNMVVNSRSILEPEVFLLHSVCITLGISKKMDKDKILSVFSRYFDKRQKVESDNESLSQINRIQFLASMIKYRRWLDDNIIYLGLLNGAYDYKFRKEDKNDFNDDAKDEIEPMRQFQSMLFVSSDEWQEWVLKAYRKCQNKPLRLEILKELDAHNEEHSLPELGDTLSLSYGSINRYWFWLLDYILWEKIREQIKKQKKEETSSNTEIELGNVHLKLSNDQKDSIINYKFRRNRSIEHLHPQSDEHLTNVEKWNQVLLEDTTIKYPKDWFGNLAMISSNFNSGQGNESIGVKFARLKDTQIPQKSLESIKMLLMFLIAGGNENEWTPDESIKHGKAMYELLKSYCDSISDTEE